MASPSPGLIEVVRAHDIHGLERLLSDDVDINYRDAEYGQTAISWAAEHGHVGAIDLLLEKNADIEIKDNWGRSALTWACSSGHPDAVLRILDKVNLLERQASESQRKVDFESDKNSTFVTAATQGWEEVISRLLAFPDFDINQRDATGNTALMNASKEGHMGIVRLLRERGADGLLENDDAETALLLAIVHGQADILDVFFEGDHAIGVDDPRLLIAASTQGTHADLNMIDALITRGANPWKADEEGLLPVHRAAETGRIDALKKLIDSMGLGWAERLLSMDSEHTMVFSALVIAVAGSERPWRNSEQQSAYCSAGDNENSCAFHYTALFGLLDAAKRLLGWGVSVNVLDDNECSALLYASGFGHSTLVELLLSKGADVNQSERRWRLTPLMHAAAKGYARVVELLCQAENQAINATTEGEEKITALMCAILAGDLDCVSHIIKRKPDLEIKDTNGRTALTVAVSSGSLEAVEILIKAGANIYEMDAEAKSPIAHAVERDVDFLKLVLRDAQGRLQARAIETALRYSCRKKHTDTIAFIMSSKDYLDSKDDAGRSLLSLAAERGNKEEIEKLCEKQLDPVQKDHNGRTPLSWAVVGRDEDTMKALLTEPKVQKAIDEWDNDKKTPLAWAAESGRVAAVKYLLEYNISRPSRQEQATTSEQASKSTRPLRDRIRDSMISGAPRPAGAGNPPTQPDPAAQKGGRAALKKKIAIDSRDSQDFTPLCHAAVKGHKEVVGLLLDYGANPKIQILPDTDVADMVQTKMSDLRKPPYAPTGLGDDLASLDEIHRKLRAFQSLSSRIEGSGPVDKKFSATVVDILEGQGYAIPKHDMIDIDRLLDRGLPQAENDVAVRWVHLPANNMRWVEILMAKLFESTRGREAFFVLQHIRWLKNQHESLRDVYHARYMQPSCQSFDFAKINAARDDKMNPASTRGCVLFMPYLHWETVEELRILQEVNRKSLQDKRSGQQTTLVTDNRRVPNGTEKLHHMYLNRDRPLHIRRTLDQYYFGDVIDTSTRDEDQTPHRYCVRQLRRPKEKAVSVMVDQLWLWIIPKWKGSPPTVVTAFPQRANRIKDASSRRMTALVFRIIQNCGDLRVRTAHDLAEIIVGECSRIYFDDRSRRAPELQFFDTYARSIAVLTNKDTKRFNEFKENVGSYGQALKVPLNEKTPEQEEEQGRALVALVDIANDISDLREIKDIKEELGMMASVFHHQKDVAETLHQFLADEIKSTHPSRHGSDVSSVTHRRLMQDDMGGREAYSMLGTIEKSQKQLEQLEGFAESAAKEIQQLLDLKNKQANLREVKSTRELDERVFMLSQQTRRQAKTIMVFTVFTIFFLPPSFMSSFLALEVAQFPWKDDKLPIGYVLKALLGVSLGIIIPTILFAFYGDILEKMRESDISKKWKKGKAKRKDEATYNDPADIHKSVNPPKDIMTNGVTQRQSAFSSMLNGDLEQGLGGQTKGTQGKQPILRVVGPPSNNVLVEASSPDTPGPNSRGWAAPFAPS